MPSLLDTFPELRDALAAYHGLPAGAAPAVPFLAGAAAVLADDTAPAKVIAIRAKLGEADLLDAGSVAEAELEGLTEVFREGGLSLSRKAIVAFQRLARWLAERHGGDEQALEGLSADTLRDELAAINGVGRATVDALLLHALRRPVYPVDRATYRVLVRHGWLDPSADYDEARAVVERPLEGDPDGMARLSAWMEQVGREFCRAAAPRCERCPLRPFLPETGPIEPG